MFYSSPNIIKIPAQQVFDGWTREMRGENRNAYNVLFGKPDGDWNTKA
jgi:hypothetical protein